MKRVLTVFCGFFLISSLGWAGPREDKAELGALLNRINSFSAHVEQQVSSESGKTLQRHSGRLSWLRPERFRWDIQHPVHRLIIGDGREVWSYDAGLKQVVLRKAQRNRPATPMGFLAGDSAKLLQHFTVVKQGQVYTLRPTTRKAAVEWILLVFSRDKLTELQFKDEFGHRSRLHFSQISQNTNLPASMFHFSPPRGVEVIRK